MEYINKKDLLELIDGKLDWAKQIENEERMKAYASVIATVKTMPTLEVEFESESDEEKQTIKI